MSAGVRGRHDDVLDGHVQVEGKGAAAEVHVLDQVLAHAREAQEHRTVTVEDVVREDEVHHVQEELGEGGERVLVRVVHSQL